MIRRLFLLATLMLLVLPASAQTERVVEIVRVEGIVDARKAAFVVDSIEDAAASGNVEVVILQIDSPGFVGSPTDLDRLRGIVSNPPLPLVSWVGPAPAVAYGGMLAVALDAPVATAAPGSRVGHSEPLVAGTADVPDSEAVLVEELSSAFRGIVDAETASPRQVIQALDGVEVATASGPVVLETIRPFVADDGSEGVTVLETVIREPNLVDATLGLAVRPDVAFFLLAVGLALAAFEFYAIGPGIAAALAVVCLALGSHGLATLPVRWWAVGLTVVSAGLLSMSYQRGRLPVVDALGISLLLLAGFFITDASPQFGPSVPGVLLTVVVVGFFFVIAMPTVARSRFSTPTVGRENMIGKFGRALGAIAPEGSVEIDGARWRALAHRESGIQEGDTVKVVGVEGAFLSVEPDREN